AIYKVIEDTVNGEFKGQVYNFGLKENGIGTTDFKYTKEVIGSENIKFVEKLKEDIISGKIKVN
ncbi:MAG: BMP family lipoprotein, partial [Cetobacterium sp.]